MSATEGEGVRIRVSPVSKVAAIMIMALGVFTLVGGLATGYRILLGSGIGITALGIALYILLYKFTRKVFREVAKAAES